MADDDRQPDRHMDHRHAPGASGLGVESDAAVHLLVLDVDPAAVDSDLRLLVGGAVEVLRESRGDVSRHSPRVLGVDRRGAVLDEVADDRVEGLGRVGVDADPRVAGVGPLDADRALVDLERPPHLEDAVKDLRQQERIDDVAANLDLVDRAGRLSGGRRRRCMRIRSRHDRCSFVASPG